MSVDVCGWFLWFDYAQSMAQSPIALRWTGASTIAIILCWFDHQLTDIAIDRESITQRWVSVSVWHLFHPLPFCQQADGIFGSNHVLIA